jgi:hypothetical protein
VGIIGREVDDEDAAHELLRSFWAAWARSSGTWRALLDAAGGVAGDTIFEFVKAGPSRRDCGARGYCRRRAHLHRARGVPGSGRRGRARRLYVRRTRRGYATDARVPLPGPTACAWRVDDEWIVIRERPLPQVGKPGGAVMTWAQENEYDSGGRSRYVLEVRLTQGLVPPA